MKIFLLSTLFYIFFPQNQQANRQHSDYRHSVISCGDTPGLNQQIIAFVKTQMNKKVGRGECWDLAAAALNSVEASWDKNYIFGKEIDPKTDCVFPGDIIQFSNVTVEYTRGTSKFKEVMDKHTAVVFEVKATGDFVMADQNTSTHGRKVGLNPLDLKNISKGKYHVYRPVK